MSIFKRGVKVPAPQGSLVSAPLGDTISTKLVQNDVGKAITYKAGTAGSAVGCMEAILGVDNSNIEGIVAAIDPNTVNEGYSFGTVQEKGQAEVIVGASGSVALFDFVVLDGAQTALGTVQANIAVKALTVDATTVVGIPLWKVTQILTGDGTTAGDKLLIERV